MRLALPIVAVQVGMMLMGVVDSLMVGHISATALAAVALGNVYFFALTILGMGLLMALDPIVAQAAGARDRAAMARGTQRGLLLAGLLAVPSSLVMLTAGPILLALGQPVQVVPAAAGYALRVAPSVLPFFVFIVFRQTLQATHHTAAILLTIVLANAANVFLNWVLIFGHFGAPAMGVFGSAWATTISRYLMAALLPALSWRELRDLLRPVHPEVFAPVPLGRMVLLGLPIGLSLQLEYGAFAAIAILMGRLGEVAMAAHQVALNLASLTFMVPLGVASAAAVLVGHAVGRGDDAGALGAARAALVYGVGFMACSALVLLAVPGFFAGLYTRDVGVLALAGVLIPIAGFFQVFDGLQVVSSGILRGMGDTRAPLVICLTGYWLVGVPVSLALGFRTPLGAAGLWWGFVAGLGAVSLILLARVRARLRRDLRRVVIDQVQGTPTVETGA